MSDHLLLITMLPSGFVSPLVLLPFPAPISKLIHACLGNGVLNQANQVVLESVLRRFKCLELPWLAISIELDEHVPVGFRLSQLVLPDLKDDILAVMPDHGLLDELAFRQAHHIDALLNLFLLLLVLFLSLILSLGVLHAPNQPIGSECDTSSILEFDKHHIITHKGHSVDLV
jgi:hypothetical protein